MCARFLIRVKKIDVKYDVDGVIISQVCARYSNVVIPPFIDMNGQTFYANVMSINGGLFVDTFSPIWLDSSINSVKVYYTRQNWIQQVGAFRSYAGAVMNEFIPYPVYNFYGTAASVKLTSYSRISIPGYVSDDYDYFYYVADSQEPLTEISLYHYGLVYRFALQYETYSSGRAEIYSSELLSVKFGKPAINVELKQHLYMQKKGV